MKKLLVQIPQKQGNTYPILIEQNLLQNPKTWSTLTKGYDHIVIITDHRVKKQYGNALAHYLTTKKHTVQLLSFPAGEKSKQQQTKQYLEEKMLRARCNRNTLCLALGGGVVGDLAGFLAATYMRGITYVQIPTTLLAMVDSSVGGKTAIDTPFGKNLIGAFWQPKAVLADLACLKTLSQKHLINGFVEAIKMFLTSDLKSLQYAIKNLNDVLSCDQKILANIIHRAVAIKAGVVEKDERENHQRMVLNFGHTIGHAIEQLSDYKMLHGYAVGYGILVEAKMSEILGFLSSKHYFIIQALFAKLGITGQALKKTNIDKIIKLTKLDKKVKTGKVNYVLLKVLGQVVEEKNKFAHPVSDSIVKQAFSKVIS
jgi:3-dehydroquinate synthase